MDFRFSPQEEAFRQKIRDWLKDNLPESWTGDRFSREQDWTVYREFAKRLSTNKWVAPHWPVEYGGLGLSVIEQLIFNEEMSYANAPVGYSVIGVGWAGPTIIVYGTEQQKRQHLDAITSAETMWCQGFSEPNAGSDLANLSTRAVKDGDDYVINGQKIWTSGAHYADWMILIARTDFEAPKHKGISYFLLDMKTPGISTRPLIDMMNNHGFNEVFFENVRVPKDCLLGEENRGWYMATTTLDFERSSIGGAVGAQKMLAELFDYTRDTHTNGHRLSDEVQVKLRLAKAGMEIMGLYGQLEPKSKWVPLRGRFERQYLWQTGLAVGGGTTEIQKNIIAQRGLGMPR